MSSGGLTQARTQASGLRLPPESRKRGAESRVSQQRGEGPVKQGGRQDPLVHEQTAAKALPVLAQSSTLTGYVRAWPQHMQTTSKSESMVQACGPLLLLLLLLLPTYEEAARKAPPQVCTYVRTGEDRTREGSRSVRNPCKSTNQAATVSVALSYVEARWRSWWRSANTRAPSVPTSPRRQPRPCARPVLRGRQRSEGRTSPGTRASTVARGPKRAAVEGAGAEMRRGRTGGAEQ